VTRGNLGVAGKVELAEMTALPPFAQVIADMSGLGSGGAGDSGLCVHGENLPCGFHSFHYLGRNRFGPGRGSSSSQRECSRSTRRRTAMINPSLFLRRAPLADAIFSGVSAVLLTLGTSALAFLLNLPEALLRETGLFLVAYAALVGWLGTRQSILRPLVWIVIAGNAAWALASIALLFSGWVAPNLLGEAAVAMQAIAVGVFAELQYVGVRRSGDALAA
jgi:hypothetical protein